MEALPTVCGGKLHVAGWQAKWLAAAATATSSTKIAGFPPHLQGATDEARRHAEDVADTAKEKYGELKVGCCRAPSLCVCAALLPCQGWLVMGWQEPAILVPCPAPLGCGLAVGNAGWV